MEKYQKGFSLVELLMVTALALVFCDWMIQFYVQMKKQIRLEQMQFELNESGLLAIEVLKRELRLSGLYADTALLPEVKVSGLGCKEQWLADVTNPVQFHDGDSGVYPAWVPCMLDEATLQKGSDIVAIKRTKVNPLYKVNGGEVIGDSNSVLNGYYIHLLGLKASGLYAVTNVSAESFVSASNDISVWQYQASIFYVRNYSVYKGDNTPALMMLTSVNNSFSNLALVEGVEKLEMSWLVKKEGQLQQYRTVFKPTPLELNQSQRAHLALLLRSQELLPQQQKVSYILSEINKPQFFDRVLRKVFSTNVFRRNAGN